MKFGGFSMLYLFLTVLLGFSNPAQANWKEKARALSQKLIGENSTTKLFGADEVSTTATLRTPPPFPKIPQVKKSNLDEKVFDDTEGKLDKTRKHQLTGKDKEKFDYGYVREVIEVTRKTPAKDQDINTWFNVLSQGGSREGVYRAMVLDGGYNSLESYPEPPNDKLIEFVISFSNKYLNKNYTPETLKKVNLYTIKRIVVDNTLDTMENFLATPDDLSIWYAYLSSEFATNYPTLWANKARKFTEYEFHEKWASEVPIQLIKSEVIIKLHLVMNTLNLVKN